MDEPVDVLPRRISRYRRPRRGLGARRSGSTWAATAVLMMLAAALMLWWTGASPHAQAETVIRTDLARQGLGAVAVTAEGRHVHLAGRLPPGITADFAVALARGAVCSSLGVSRPCAETVTAQLSPAVPGVGSVTGHRPTP